MVPALELPRVHHAAWCVKRTDRKKSESGPSPQIYTHQCAEAHGHFLTATDRAVIAKMEATQALEKAGAKICIEVDEDVSKGVEKFTTDWSTLPEIPGAPQSWEEQVCEYFENCWGRNRVVTMDAPAQRSAGARPKDEVSKEVVKVIEYWQNSGQPGARATSLWYQMACRMKVVTKQGVERA